MCTFSKFAFPGSNEQDLLQRLDVVYKSLELILKSNGGYLIKHGVLKRASGSKLSLMAEDAMRHGPADAVLFGHIAEALGNNDLVPVANILEKYPTIMSFFYKMLNDFFLNPDTASPPSWQVRISKNS
jgi:hypothetical protein